MGSKLPPPVALAIMGVDAALSSVSEATDALDAYRATTAAQTKPERDRIAELQATVDAIEKDAAETDDPLERPQIVAKPEIRGLRQ